MKHQDGLYTVDQVINKDMGFNMQMNKYVCKDGSVAVMHNNKTNVQTADGRNWTLASSIVTVTNAAIPAATTPEPTPAPTPAPIAKPTLAPLKK